MPSDSKFAITRGPARNLILVALVFYIAAGIYLNVSPPSVELFHHKIRSFLICHTMILTGFCLHYGALMSRPAYRRNALMWLAVPVLLFYAGQVVFDWIRLFA